MGIIKNKFFIIFLSVSVLGLLVIFSTSIKQLVTPQPKAEVFTAAITKSFPNLLSNNEPVFTLQSVSRHKNIWYVATLKSTKEVDTLIPVRVLLVNSSGGLRVIYGPEAIFSDSQYQEMREYNIPESVIEELSKS